MLTRKKFFIITGILALIWIGVSITIFVDFESLLDKPEDLVLRFQEALKKLDFEKAWSKLSTRMKKDDFRDKADFTLWIYYQSKLRKDIAYAFIHSSIEIEPGKFKLLLRNNYYRDYAILMVKKEKNGVWKIDEIKANLIL